ncbi:MAG: HlyD family efflux transporter periplasmic adaptor subunit [Gammaproteobacteria bacterium]|nr:HlyD family efflux transporter periplasmic adaptor subunit [Gammaproteobacteria bacterium]MXW10305.1 HlyD family efflux transporter periplasmic adaptor subunit [Gammaproteobacteria bacterium]MYC51460.1 HlyD family efflux transporter periplasmic adaptor subunit [Gammaproteobacteria bacterium]
MDIIRDTGPRKRKKKLAWSATAIGAFAIAVFGWQLLPSGVPTVDAAIVWSDTVAHGTLIRQVRGPGTLVPEQMRWITAVTAGRIEQILSLPGADVSAGDLIMRLSNPDVDMQLLQAQQQLSAAHASLVQLRTSLRMQELQQRATTATVRADYLEADRIYRINQQLFDENPELVARADLDRSRESVEALSLRLETEAERLAVIQATTEDQISAQEEQITRLADLVRFSRDRIRSMQVAASVSGVLAPLDIPLQEGQWVQSGQALSRVVVPGRLKAEIRIPQTQAQEIAVGQVAMIDTRTDTIQGRVVRIDPAVRSGTVTIDVALPPSLPSARPDLSVDGSVIVERLDDVVHMGRPTFGQANQQMSLFKLVDGGRFAERVTVRLGASSLNDIEVREGLQPGDVVILSDMSQWDGFSRVRLRGRGGAR